MWWKPSTFGNDRSRKQRGARLASRLTIGLGLCAAAHAYAEPYTFGAVPQFDQRHLYSTWRPILDEINRATGLPFRLQGTPEIPMFERALEEGDYDFAYTNAYLMVSAHESQGYRPLVRDVGRNLQGIVVVRKDSPARTIRALDGAIFCFPSPNAFGASLLVRAELRDQFHMDFESRYVKTHTSVYLNVVKGLADAGGGVQSTLDAQEPAIRKALRVIHRTREAPSHPIAVHPRVPAADQEKVRNAFLALGESARGRALLARVPIKQIGATTLEDFARVRLPAPASDRGTETP
jgi:phosphonate transport system substrate-binding protein